MIAFVLVTLAACMRAFGPLLGDGGSYFAWLAASGAAWSLAFALSFFAYAKILVSPRADGEPG